ncbi:hypothetical protein [Veronia nyctiphanis]|uniref:hypothetical protein n=1 Tax=Veronia nyctiphanis TaxID=1278244 RepID=UPI001375C533|nr:hypothetical protein [Veronia nyctiphanis]
MIDSKIYGCESNNIKWGYTKLSYNTTKKKKRKKKKEKRKKKKENNCFEQWNYDS